MWEWLLKAWPRLRLLIGLMVLAALLFLLPARFTAPARVVFNEAVGPVQSGVLQGAGEVLAASGTLSDMFLSEARERALAREVVRLHNENVKLAEELIRRRFALASADRLQVKRFPFHAVRAPVGSYDTAAMRRSITVRAGGRDGVGPGMAATADGALVGIVQEAGPRQCRVRLITDPQSMVPCRLSRTRGLYILQGTGATACNVDWVTPDSFAEPGDVLVTSSMHLDAKSRLRIPDGLPAATIAEVEPDEMRPLFLAVAAAPGTNLGRLEAVEILIPAEPE